MTSDYRTGRTIAICLDTEVATKLNVVIGVTKIVTIGELKMLSDGGYTNAQAARYFNVPDSTFRTFLNRNKLRYLFTMNKKKIQSKQGQEGEE